MTDSINSTIYNKPPKVFRSPQRDIRTFSGIVWSGQKIVIHAVKVGGNWTNLNKDSSIPTHKTQNPVFGFAFCKEGVGRPFALTGMRHLVYYHMKNVEGMVEPPEYDAELGVRCLRNQYNIHKDKMMEELGAQIDPTTSTLNHRERFALQLSFIQQACTIHKNVLGPHKRLLRSVASEWYHRRLVKNAKRAEAMGLPIDSFICPQNGMPNPDLTDMSYVFHAMNTTKKDVQPFWCFSSTVH